MTMSSGADAGEGGRRSFIDSDSHFVGTYTTPNDLHVEGHYEGTIECAGSLVVAGTADVNAQVSAGAISVVGHLQGEIACHGRFEILPTGRVEARVAAGTIVVHEGAQYQGEMRMRSEGVEQPVDRAATGRAEQRSGRRASTAETQDVPSYASHGRTNGHTQTDDGTGSSSEADRASSPGRPAPE